MVMFFFECSLYNMGGANSSEQVTNVLNEATMSVLNSFSQSAESTTVQRNTFRVANSQNVKARDVNMSNIAKINIQSIGSAVQDGSLQSKLEQKLVEKLQQESKSTLVGVNNATIHNTVRNKINSQITNENISKAISLVQQYNEAEITNSRNVDVSKLVFKNEADAVIKIFTDTNSSIAMELTSKSDQVRETSQKTDSFMTDMFQTVRSAFTEMGQSSRVFIVIGGIVVIVLAFLGAYLSKHLTGNAMKTVGSIGTGAASIVSKTVEGVTDVAKSAVSSTPAAAPPAAAPPAPAAAAPPAPAAAAPPAPAASP
jgi:hypothetical protein